MEETQPDPDPILCPACGQPVPTPQDPTQLLIECFHCHHQFFLSTEEPEPADEPEEPAPQDDGELDGLRIRQLVHLRRSNIRSRTHAIVATLCCGVAAGQLLYLTQRHVAASGWTLRAILYVAAAFVAVVGTTFFSRKVAALHREVKAAPPPDPETPPHFDELSDGSQHAKNLEQM